VFLQSLTTADLAFPLVAAHALAQTYPDTDVVPAATAAGLGARIEDLAVLVVLSALNGQPPTVNLLAPLVINVATRRGAQVMLEDTRFTTRELLLLASTESAGERVAAPANDSAPAEAASAP
jgi:flagellar assembly factor FliW